jgi:hypothetical protein
MCQILKALSYEQEPRRIVRKRSEEAEIARMIAVKIESKAGVKQEVREVKITEKRKDRKERKPAGNYDYNNQCPGSGPVSFWVSGIRIRRLGILLTKRAGSGSRSMS